MKVWWFATPFIAIAVGLALGAVLVLAADKISEHRGADVPRVTNTELRGRARRSGWRVEARIRVPSHRRIRLQRGRGEHPDTPPLGLAAAGQRGAAVHSGRPVLDGGRDNVLGCASLKSGATTSSCRSVGRALRLVLMQESAGCPYPPQIQRNRRRAIGAGAGGPAPRCSPGPAMGGARLPASAAAGAGAVAPWSAGVGTSTATPRRPLGRCTPSWPREDERSRVPAGALRATETAGGNHAGVRSRETLSSSRIE